MMNKKANLPIIILVVGTIAVCIIALMSFSIVRDKQSESIGAFRELRVMHVVRDSLQFSGMTLEELRDEGNYYDSVVGELQIEGGYLVLDRDDYVLRVPLLE